MKAGTTVNVLSQMDMGSNKITNVANGTADNDAVNVSQLKGVTTALGGGAAVNADGTIKKPSYNVAGSTYGDVGAALSAVDAKASTGSADGVKYDTSAHDKVTFSGANGTTLSNVNAGKADKDAVNVAQLKAAGLNIDTSGAVTNSFVAYDDATKGKVTLAGGSAGTTITNLKAGAVNATSKDAINGSQLFTLAASEAAALGGGSAVNTDGSISKPTYSVDGKSVSGVDGAVSALDTRITNATANNVDIASKMKYVKFGDTTALDATASGENSVAIGGYAQAIGANSLAIGAQSRAMGANSVAVGYGSSATQDNTFAVGSTTLKRRVVNVADATGVSDAVTLGQMNTAIGAAIVNSGVKSNGMLGASTMLLGATASSKTPDQLIVSGPTSLSTPTDAIGRNGIAMGLNAHANADNAVAAGQNVSVLGANGVAVGQNIAVGADSAVGIGVGTSVASENAVAIGSNGTEVNTGAANAVAIGSGVSVGGQNSVGLGSNIIVGTANSVVLGANSSDDNRANTVSVGSSAVPGMGTSLVRRQVINVAAGTQDFDAVNVSQLKGVTTALGGGAGVNTDGSIKKPSYNVAGGTYNDVGTALAAVDSKAGSGSVDAVKYDTSAHDKVTFNGSNGTTLSNVNAGKADKDAVNVAQLKAAGLNIDTSGAVTNSFVAYDDATKGKVTLAGGSAGTTITNVKAGAVSASSKDAINGSQLYGEASSTAAALGGGAAVNSDGTIKAPTYTVQGQTKGDVGSALAAIDTATTGNTTSITNLTNNINNGTIGLVQQDKTTKAITVAKATDGTTVDFTGTAGARQLKGVSTGSADTDAVNVAQLKAAGLNIDTSGTVTNSFVAYDDATKGKVTLAGTNGTTISNVNAGKADKDAVNVAQLKAAGLNIDTSGTVTNSFVAYDDATKGKVTLAGGAAGTTITNVKAGAVNASSMDAVNGSQLYNTANSTAAALGGGTTVDANGKITKPSYNVAGSTYGDVGSALAAVDAKAATGSIDGVKYDSSAHDKVTFNGSNGTKLSNVTAGTADMDAVNLAQLKAAGLNVDTSGNVTNSFVAYDDATKGKVTLAGGSAGTTITNVKAGALNATSTEAVNGAQLYATNQNVSSLSTQVTNINAQMGDVVKYDTSAHDKVTFNGSNGTTLSNVNAGKADKDAVNVAQLKAAGLNIDTSGAVTNSFVAYDDATKGKVTLAGGSAGTTISNVKAAKADNEAVNLAQLKAAGLNVDTSGTVTNSFVAYDDATKGKVTLAGGAAGTTITNVKAGAVNASSMDAINGSQLYNTANSTAAALGGGTTVDANGKITKPSYNVAGSTYGDVGSALAAVDAKAATGSIDGVKYDSSAHDKVTFNGSNGTKLSNVTAGTADMDAVNLAQLKAAGLNVDTSGNVTNSFVAYDDATKGKVTLAGGAAGTTITNVKAGAVSASSTDAINGSQLYSLAASETKALGGGSTVNPDGTISMPEYSVGGKTVDGVDGAVTALDTRITDMSSAMVEIAPKLKYIKFGDTTALDATASGADAVAIGGYAQAMGDGALAIGANARAMATNSVAIGFGSSTSQANTFAVGSTTGKRRIVNVADGTSITDAVTVGQMNTAIGAAISGSGVKNNGMLGASTMLLGATSSKTPDQLIVSGPTTLSTPTDALGKNGIAMGLNAHANADNAVAAGQNVSVLGSNGVAVGQNIAIGADSAVGIGSTVSAASINSVAIGSNGTEVNTGSDNAVAIGSNVSIGGKNTVGIGSNIVAATEGSVVLGANSSDDNRANTVSVGSSAVPGMGTSLVRRQVINVAAGTQDFDAVNVSQLKGVTSALGGGATVNADGSVKKPSYAIGGNTYTDVGSAFSALASQAGSGSVDGVSYDTSAHDKVTFNGASGTTLSNVKAGALSATSMDAVNGSQLYATNQNVAKNTGDITTLNTQITTINGQLADAVKYDSSAHDKVSLAGGAAGTTITNVKAGAVSSSSMDAVNGSQLYNTASSTAAALGGGSSVNADGTVKKPSYNVAGSTYGDVGSALAAVDAKAATGSVDGIKYDTSAHDRVTFNGANGTTLSNVNAGKADKDAVNVAQLKSAGLNIDTSGNVTNSFVSYDDASKGKITLGGAAGTTIANVKAGAVNATSKDAINGSQLFNTASSTAAALGGGSTVNADGTISAPTYALNEGSTTVHTVGDAITNIDGRVTQNTSDITNITNTLVDGGVIDGSTGKSLAVVYDSATKDSVTFGGKGATAPVALHNVAAGELSATSNDAVNGSQLFTTNKRIDEINHNAGNIGDVVMYDTSAHDRITLGGLAGGMSAPVILSNVADGKSKYDAVNFGQLSALQGQVTNLDNRVTVVEGQVTNISGGGGSWNNDAGGKKITNVADGTEKTDAVNVGQLNEAVQSANNYTDSRIGELPSGMSSKDYVDQSMKSMQSQVNSVAKNSYGGIAAATALTMIPDVDQGKTIAVGVGTGNYKGYQAVALGASARITQNLKVKVGAGMAPGNGTTVGAGASYQW
ncbi:YadA-like family protein [Paraburkholderia edwinii]|uniref:YadA-like family protein n=1 Tax=Paraburkholderia edwinii TaxID=2861782 RepID=UPI001FE3EDFD|nr:YadA-like family protein [Paraburkholderia edwinii]